YLGLPVLMKAQGKCTTDHISAAGKWLTYRGHLENISGNLFLGAINAYGDQYEAGHGKDVRDGSVDTFPNLARKYSEAGIRWCAIGDRNYGEGSSREHAAMEPRFRGGVVIFARSFARIHETNLKKQGMLALTFANPADYDKIRQDDLIDIQGVEHMAPGQPLTIVLRHRDGTEDRFQVNHTYNAAQIEWLKEGSALNKIRRDFGQI
ncbi:MAG TPA: aconitate hydratase, partial [Saprospiraceae bacterium]|nr:aconitate hydratase [Saprospiraceae bacterium]